MTTAATVTWSGLRTGQNVGPAPTIGRYGFLDVLRGVALCGILFVNLRDLLYRWTENADLHHPVLRFYGVVIQGRFVPIFAFLFGVSAWLLYSSTQRRMPVRSARWLMVRRFATLLPIGLLNLFLLYSGDILTMYAVIALVLVVPALFLPRGPVLVLGIVGTLVAYWMWGNSPLIAATLMVAGFGAAQFGLPQWLESTRRRDAVIAAVVVAASAAAGVGLTILQNSMMNAGALPAPDVLDRVGGFAGLFTAVAIVTGLSLLWRACGGRGTVTSAPFSILGRTALTNYLAASAVVQILLHVFPDTQLTNLWWLPVATVGILIVQILASAVWLRYFRYGPVEWAWRCATRWEIVPIRK
ncbi:Putative membrane protein [Corynebacterium glyciniphilum AJ 3170]|uniref:Putative membrane protein n=2 Tax=Corynebacterium TaxID=1716 RepID=X5DPH5_9CORY|nr:DUF418 domain-containing protein [Corynebacterium glyciniphilum]AHW65103.1 Putative membrane protein [Corynebacterium glyciniphilum AJ 3170]